MDKNNLSPKNGTFLLPQAALVIFVCPEYSRDKRKKESSQCTLWLCGKNTFFLRNAKKMLKESSPHADIPSVMKEEMGLQDIQSSFRDDVEQIEKTVEKIRRKRKHRQTSAVQPQQQDNKPCDGKRPPTVINWQKGV
jgi:hypothetical protein